VLGCKELKDEIVDGCDDMVELGELPDGDESLAVDDNFSET